MIERIEIDGKKYKKRTIELLTGVKNFHELDENLKLLAEAIENPSDFPFVLEDIYDMDFDDDIRLALVRIQIDSKLHMHDDLEGMQLRLYVSETIEKMLFGELLMEGNGKGKEKETKKPKKKPKKKSKQKPKSKGSVKGGGRGMKKGKTKKGDKDSTDGWGTIYI